MRLGHALAMLVTLLGVYVHAVPQTSSSPPTGVVAGRVTDADGQVLPGTTVVISGEGLEERTALTDVDGRYRIDGLTLGSYTLTASLQGFQTARRQLTLTATAAPEQVEIALEVGCLSEYVPVRMPIEYLLTHSDLVARIRIVSVGELREWTERGCPSTGREYVASLDDVIQGAASTGPQPETVVFLAGREVRFKRGDELLALLLWWPPAERFVVVEDIVLRGGRIRTKNSSVDELDGLTADEAIRVMQHIARFPKRTPAGPAAFDDLTVPPDRQLPECALRTPPWIGDEPGEVRRIFKRMFPKSADVNRGPGPFPDSSAVVQAYAAKYKRAGGGETEVLALRFREPDQAERRFPPRRFSGFGAIRVDTIIAAVMGPPSLCLPVAAAHLRSLEP